MQVRESAYVRWSLPVLYDGPRLGDSCEFCRRLSHVAMIGEFYEVDRVLVKCVLALIRLSFALKNVYSMTVPRSAIHSLVSCVRMGKKEDPSEYTSSIALCFVLLAMFVLVRINFLSIKIVQRDKVHEVAMELFTMLQISTGHCIFITIDDDPFGHDRIGAYNRLFNTRTTWSNHDEADHSQEAADTEKSKESYSEL